MDSVKNRHVSEKKSSKAFNFVQRLAGTIKTRYRFGIESIGKECIMPNRFNVDGDAVRQLAELLNDTGLSEIEYEVEGRRIRVAKSLTITSSAVPHYSPSPASATNMLREDGPPGPADVKSSAEHPGAVKSPMVGTIYLAPAPGAAPFVKAGDTVAKGDTLLIIEAMKVMNPIRAPQSGRISSILVNDADPVEYGAPLMVIES